MEGSGAAMIVFLQGLGVTDTAAWEPSGSADTCVGGVSELDVLHRLYGEATDTGRCSGRFVDVWPDCFPHTSPQAV